MDVEYCIEDWADVLRMHCATVCFPLGLRWTPGLSGKMLAVADIAAAFDIDGDRLASIMESGARLMTLHDIAERYGFDYVRMLLWRRFDPGVLPEPIIKKSRKLLRWHPADVRAALPRMRARDRQADQHHLSKSNRILEAA